MQKTVLFVDNHHDFLMTWAEYLEQKGYFVYKAESPDDARKIIDQGDVHFAIFDKRLIDDFSQWDTTGIDLARDPALKFLPSMILSGYSTSQHVRSALLPGETSAVDFIDKEADGPLGMLEAVDKAFTSHLHINWDLNINWEDGCDLSVRAVLDLIDKNLDHDEFRWRSDELEALLRMVFYDYVDVTILQKLWVDAGRFAFLVRGHTGQADRYLAVTIGSEPLITAELANQKAFPDDPGEGGTTHAGYYRRAHYAANAWRLSGLDIEKVEQFLDAAKTLKENQLSAVLAKFFQGTLAAWHRQREPLESESSAVDSYRQFYPIFQLDHPDRVFIDRVKDVSRLARRHLLVQEIVLGDYEWRIEFNPRLHLTFPNPCGQLFYSSGDPGSQTNYTQYSPGAMKLNTILLGPDQVTWLTDFAQVSELPVWHDFASIECELRFQLLELSDLTEVLHMERQLCPSWPVVPRAGVDTTADLRKLAACILKVRELAAKGHNGPHDYAQCLLVNALSEFLGSEPPPARARKDLARLLHRLILAGCVTLDLSGAAGQETSTQYLPLEIDTEGTVRRGGDTIYLTDTEQKIIFFLNRHEDKFCKRELICREALDIPDPSPSQLQGLIDSNINRLRKKIEPDPNNPHYIITMYRQGVRLNKNPTSSR